MTTLIAADPKKLMHQNLAMLREYATEVIVRGNTLTVDNEDDRARRMQEFLAIGRSFQLTERDVVCLLYKELLAKFP